MPDATVTIDYTITALTNNSDLPQTASVEYTLSHADTALEEDRTDTFLVSELTNSIETSTDTLAERQAQLQTNFEALALFFFTDFASKVKAAQGALDAADLVDLVGDVEINSFSKLLTLQGRVIISI